MALSPHLCYSSHIVVTAPIPPYRFVNFLGFLVKFEDKFGFRKGTMWDY